MTERLAYLIFINAVGLALGLFSVSLVIIAVMLVRRHRRSREH